MGLVRDYSHIHEIHLEPGLIHEPYNPQPLPYSAALESALNRVAQQDVSRLKGTEFDIVMRRIEAEGDTRYPLAPDERKVGISANTPM